MSLLLRTERAFQKLLLGSAAYLVVGDGSFVVTDKGLRITLADGFTYDLPVARGQDDVEFTGPGVLCSCPSGTQVENGTRTMRVDVVIELHFPVDEGQRHRFLLDGFEYAVAQLAQALYRHDLPQLLSATENGFTVLHAPGAWTEESGFTDRLRTYRFQRPLIVAPTDFPVVAQTYGVRYGLSLESDFVEVSVSGGPPSWDNAGYTDVTATAGQSLVLDLDPQGTPKYLLVAIPETVYPLASVVHAGTGDAIPMAGPAQGFMDVSGALHFKRFQPTGAAGRFRAYRTLGLFSEPVSVRLG